MEDDDDFWRPLIIEWVEEGEKASDECDSGAIDLREGYRRLGAIIDKMAWQLRVGSWD